MHEHACTLLRPGLLRPLLRAMPHGRPPAARADITGGQSVVLSSVLEAAMLINPTPPVRAATCNGSTQYSTVSSSTRQYGLNLTRCGECTRGTIVPVPLATGNIGLASCSSVTAGFGYDPAASSLVTAVASTKPCPGGAGGELGAGGRPQIGLVCARDAHGA